MYVYEYIMLRTPVVYAVPVPYVSYVQPAVVCTIVTAQLRGERLKIGKKNVRILLKTTKVRGQKNKRVWLAHGTRSKTFGR